MIHSPRRCRVAVTVADGKADARIEDRRYPHHCWPAVLEDGRVAASAAIGHHPPQNWRDAVAAYVLAEQKHIHLPDNKKKHLVVTMEYKQN